LSLEVVRNDLHVAQKLRNHLGLGRGNNASNRRLTVMTVTVVLGATAITVAWVSPMHNRALLYFMDPEQTDA
jgi:hypothetical protein